MIPTEVKLALYRISLFCKEHEFCKASCPLFSLCAMAFDIQPDKWEKMLAEGK